MIEIRDNERLRRSYQLVTVLGISLGAMMALYGLGAEVWLRLHPDFAGLAVDGGLQILRPVLYGLALLLLAASGWVRRRLLGEGFSLQVMVQTMVPQERLTAMLRAVLLGFALCEAAALLGLVLFMLSGRRLDLYLLQLPALAWLAIQFPRYQQWQAWYALRSHLR